MLDVSSALKRYYNTGTYTETRDDMSKASLNKYLFDYLEENRMNFQELTERFFETDFSYDSTSTLVNTKTVIDFSRYYQFITTILYIYGYAKGEEIYIDFQTSNIVESVDADYTFSLKLRNYNQMYDGVTELDEYWDIDLGNIDINDFTSGKTLKFETSLAHMYRNYPFRFYTPNDINAKVELIGELTVNAGSVSFDAHMETIDMKFADISTDSASIIDGYVADAFTTTTVEDDFYNSLSFDRTIENNIEISNYDGSIYVDNENLVQEGISITESVCSEDNLKLGLCESAHCKIKLFDKVSASQWIGEELSVTHSVVSESSYDNVTIDHITNQSYTLIHPTAVGDLPSWTFGARETNYISVKIRAYVDTIGYGRIGMSRTNLDDSTSIVGILTPGYNEIEFTAGGMKSINMYASYSSDLGDITLNIYECTVYYWRGNSSLPLTNSVPLGSYIVENVSRGSNSRSKDLDCYDKSYGLDVNVNDWYNSYMYGFDQNTSTDGFEYGRQIFATYNNLLGFLGFGKKRTTTTDLTLTTTGNVYQIFDGYINVKLRYAYVTVNRVSSVVTNEFIGMEWNDIRDLDMEIAEIYMSNVDSELRGINGIGSILIEEFDSNGDSINKFMCDHEDVFFLSPNTDTYTVQVPYMIVVDDVDYYQITTRLYKTSSGNAINIDYMENFNKPFLYYDYFTHEIPYLETEISARDVIRSLVEMCGAFFKIDRYGQPKLIYSSLSTLYPSETLYPSDYIYPTAQSELYDKSRYIEFYAEEYKVENIGKIQIIGSDTSGNSGVVRYEYVGDEANLNTYLITDNVFLCDENVTYASTYMPLINNLLKSIMSRVANLGYTPYEAELFSLPYVETGDRITMLDDDGGFESFVFERDLSGIVAMIDDMSASGDKVTSSYDTYYESNKLTVVADGVSVDSSATVGINPVSKSFPTDTSPYAASILTMSNNYGYSNIIIDYNWSIDFTDGGGKIFIETLTSQSSEPLLEEIGSGSGSVTVAYSQYIVIRLVGFANSGSTDISFEMVNATLSN